MDSGDQGAGTPEPPGRDLSLQEAARLYDVSVRVLRDWARWGRLAARKVGGPSGQEWRVSERSLVAAGLSRRAVPLATGGYPSRVAYLEAELASLRHALSVERFRAEQADRELGQAMLESGRLRSALARALQDVERCKEPCADDFVTGA